MDWLSTGSCSAAHRFGWLMGTGSGLYAITVITILIVTAPAYHPDVPLAVGERMRVRSQWILFFSQLLLIVVWLLGGLYVGWNLLACYVVTLSLAGITVVAPIMLLFMFTSANWVGRAMAR